MTDIKKPPEAVSSGGRRAHGGGKLPPSAAGEPVFTGGNKRGQDTKYGFLSPLDSPHLPLR